MVEVFTPSTDKCILRKTEDITPNDSTILSLENKNLIEVPQKVLWFNQLKHLSLNGNCIRVLPDEFYKAFPHLTWLDLRFNKLESISRAVVNLSSLKNLLVGNNNIRRLCIELGGINSLTGLNIEGNPIDFPPQDILSKGASYTIRFLRKCYSKRLELERLVSGEMSKKDLIDDGDSDGMLEKLDQLAVEAGNDLMKLEESEKPKTNPPLYESKLYRRFKKEMNAFNKVEKGSRCLPRQSDRQAFFHQAKNKLVSVESIHKAELSEMRQLKSKMENIRRDRVLQRLKNKEAIDDWKVSYRVKQSTLSDIYKYKSREEIKEESLIRIRIAPYDINGDDVSVMSQYDLEKLKLAPKPGISPPPRPRPRSADSVLKLEMATRNKEKNLIDDVNKQAELLYLKIENPCLPLSVSDAEADLANALQLQLRLRNRQDVITQLKMSTHPTAFLM
nr:leucine rich repeat containing protein 27 [Hymenolepis microstoma]